ncbi:MAG: C_GCAxxG_C_C family protein [Clostridiales bacterium]|jgi:C_GCAxxG_C_C family probable redox protein|nr:C_GCAxxG_C_C family protein [Clostridiales bacterium]
MDEKKALEMYLKGFDCSQVVLSSVAEQLGIDKQTAMRVASAFGGGMGRGDTCGCVTGALMALGLKYGFYEDNDEEGQAAIKEKKEEFERRFTEQFGALHCRDLLGGDVSVPEERAALETEGTIMNRCPGFAAGAVRILEDMLED